MWGSMDSCFDLVSVFISVVLHLDTFSYVPCNKKQMSSCSAGALWKLEPLELLHSKNNPLDEPNSILGRISIQ